MLKTLSFAVLHFTVAFTVTYLLTGDILIGGAVAMIEPAVNTVVFYFHELGWNRWGEDRDALLEVFAERA